jgi:(4S)-4-hydroxy-5-phosphonooxypentane-2,3-dione isomerase
MNKVFLEGRMLIVHVFIQVKPEYIGDFITASVINASQSIQEPGIARFDFIQEQEDPTKFVLVEVYRSPADSGKHKETQHYQTWRDEVEGMMVVPRSSIKYYNVYPPDDRWG